MNNRTLTARRYRRTFGIAMGLSVAIHVVVLALLRFGVWVPNEAPTARASASSEDRFLAQRPIRVVRIADQAPASRAEAQASGAYPSTSAAREPADAAAVAAPRLNLSAGGLDLRPVEGTSGGLENVVLASAALSADGASADLNEGVSFEAASRAAREAARKKGRDRRGARGSGIGIAVVGPGGGECDPSLLPGGVTIPAVVDDFAGAFGGSSPAGGRSAPGGLVGGTLVGGGRNLGGASVLGGRPRIRIGGGSRIGGR